MRKGEAYRAPNWGPPGTPFPDVKHAHGDDVVELSGRVRLFGCWMWLLRLQPPAALRHLDGCTQAGTGGGTKSPPCTQPACGGPFQSESLAYHH